MLFHDGGANQFGLLLVAPMSARPQVFHFLPLPHLLDPCGFEPGYEQKQKASRRREAHSPLKNLASYHPSPHASSSDADQVKAQASQSALQLCG